MTSIVEVQTGLLWDWRIDRGRGSEKGHLIEMAPDLPANALLLGDGNFVGFPIWSQLHDHGKRFLIRVGGNVHLIEHLWPDAETRCEGNIVFAWPKSCQKKSPPVTLRLIKVGRGQKAVHLLTNILDSMQRSNDDAGDMYRQRWGVETFFRTMKRTLGYVKLPSRTGRRARIELEWALITLMIATMMGIDSATRRGIDPTILSPAHLIGTLRSSLLHGSGKHPPTERAALARALTSELKDTYVRHKPKRSRHHPKTKNTPKPLTLKPPKIRRATAQEKELARQYPKQVAA